MQLSVTALRDIGLIEPGNDLPRTITQAIATSGVRPTQGDVCTVSSKIISKAEGRFVTLSSVDVGEDAENLARRCKKDPRLVQLILNESTHVSRVAPEVIVTRHRLGFVSANAAIDASNVGKSDVVLLMPEDPARSARQILEAIKDEFGVSVPVIVTDSHGRPFRFGTVGVAVACVGMNALVDQRGSADLHGRVMEATQTALADQIATTADLVAGQGSEGRPVVWVRGVDPTWTSLHEDKGTKDTVMQLIRPTESDLYA